MHMSVFTCVYMFVSLHACMCVHVPVSISDIFFLRSQGFLLPQDSVRKLGWMVRELQGSPVSALPPSTEIIAPRFFFNVGSRMKLGLLYLSKKHYTE